MALDRKFLKSLDIIYPQLYMFLGKFKKQEYKRKKKNNFFRYFRPVFIILGVIAAGFFVYERTAYEPLISFPIEPEKVEQEVIKEEVESGPETIKEPERNVAQAPQKKLDNGLFTATFTDGFSSQAWLDVGQTDLYFDWTGTNLLFPISMTTQEISAQQALELNKIFTDRNEEDSILSLPKIVELVAKKNPKQVVVVKVKNSNAYMIGLAQEKAFEIWEYDPIEKEVKLLLGKTAEYTGHLALLARDNNVFVLWASYFTLGYEIDNNGAIKDLTSDFGWRVSSNNAVKLYEIDDFVYIVNEDGSIIRYNDEISVRIDQEFWFTYQPESLKMADNYLIAKVPNGGEKIYQFEDRGFNLQGARQVVSKKVNFAVKNIGAAQISNLDAGVENSDTKYFLSNDGGVSWQETSPGEIVIFENQDNANDLRWKIVITPALGGETLQKKTPYLSSIHFKYWYRR